MRVLRVEGCRCDWICEVQFERRERGATIRVPWASGGIGRGVMLLSWGSATKREMSLS